MDEDLLQIFMRIPSEAENPGNKKVQDLQMARLYYAMLHKRQIY